jgi:hypothetical protein
MIRRYERFFSIAECKSIQDASTGLMRPSVVVSKDRGAGKRIDGRTNTVAWVQHDQSEPVRAALLRVADAVGLPVRNMHGLESYTCKCLVAGDFDIQMACLV